MTAQGHSQDLSSDASDGWHGTLSHGAAGHPVE